MENLYLIINASTYHHFRLYDTVIKVSDYDGNRVICEGIIGGIVLRQIVLRQIILKEDLIKII